MVHTFRHIFHFLQTFMDRTDPSILYVNFPYLLISDRRFALKDEIVVQNSFRLVFE